MKFKSGNLRLKYEKIEKKYRDSFGKIANRTEYMGVGDGGLRETRFGKSRCLHSGVSLHL